MAKTIYPGNWTNQLSSWQNQAVIAMPGRAYFSVLGYALITSSSATAWPIRIPSPDMRQDDKPRADIPNLVLPAGAAVYSVGLRIPDMRKERSEGVAFSGLVGTNTQELKVADAIGTDGAITTTTVGTAGAAATFSGGTIAPLATRTSIVTPAILAGSETLQLFNVAPGTPDTAGSGVTSTVAGGTPVIVEVNYYLDDDMPDMEAIRVPFRVEN
jgi:hypothetical protein